MTKQDILDYLNCLKKPLPEDPRHKSIGTYNGRQRVFLKFFRWLYNPDEPNHRKRITPTCMMGIKALTRKERSPYNPEDIWRQEDHTLFLKYCNVPRDRCWHGEQKKGGGTKKELGRMRTTSDSAVRVERGRTC